MILKKCSRCEEEKEATRDFFHSDKTHPDGLSSQCKACRSLRSQQRKQYKGTTKLKATSSTPDQRDLVSMANRAALKVLVQRHEYEFKSLVKSAMGRLGPGKQWRQVV